MTGDPWDASYQDGPAPWDTGRPQQQPTAKHKQAAGALGGGVAAVGQFLQSKEGKQLQKTVMRGVFGMLKKKL